MQYLVRECGLIATSSEKCKKWNYDKNEYNRYVPRFEYLPNQNLVENFQLCENA